MLCDNIFGTHSLFEIMDVLHAGYIFNALLISYNLLFGINLSFTVTVRNDNFLWDFKAFYRRHLALSTRYSLIKGRK